jgi:hypothetical protein
MTRRSPAYPASPAVVQASPHHTTGRSPHHRSGTSPHHASAPGSSVRSGSPSEAAQALQASLDTLLQARRGHPVASLCRSSRPCSSRQQQLHICSPSRAAVLSMQRNGSALRRTGLVNLIADTAVCVRDLWIHRNVWLSLQGLTKTGYLNDPALKATTFDPAFIKVVFDCASFLCVQGSAAAVLLVWAVLQQGSSRKHACGFAQQGGVMRGEQLRACNSLSMNACMPAY